MLILDLRGAVFVLSKHWSSLAFSSSLNHAFRIFTRIQMARRIVVGTERNQQEQRKKVQRGAFRFFVDVAVANISQTILK